jgi:hypothetical protein
MAGVTNDLAFFCDHRMTALRAGVKKFLAFRGVSILFHLLTELEKGRQGFDDRLRGVFVLIHEFRLTRFFGPFQASLHPL